MSTLHTVNKSPFERGSMATAFAHVSEGDARADDRGRRVRRAQGRDLRQDDRKAPRCDIYALGPDLAARGVKTEDLIEGVKVVGYDGFVDLVAGHARVCAWL